MRGENSFVRFAVLLALSCLSAQNLVKDIRQQVQQNSSSPGRIAVLGNQLLFPATTIAAGRELYFADLTGNSRLVKDIAPGSASSNLQELYAVGQQAFFFADPGSGMALWRTDGTTSGTIPLRNLSPASNAVIANLNGLALLFADDGLRGIELWRSDGTPGGTSMVVDMEWGPTGGQPLGAAVVGNEIWYLWQGANDKLIRSDGTAAGTRVVTSSATGGPSFGYSGSIGVIGNSVLFSGSSNSDWELWTSNGTAAGTRLLVDLDPTSSSDPQQFVNSGNMMMFVTSSGSPYITDGTSVGTRSIPMHYAGHLVGIGGGSFLALGGFSPPLFGLWRIDSSTPTLLASVNLRYRREPELVATQGGRAYFVAASSLRGYELWTSDGTAAGTVELRDIAQGQADANINSLMTTGSHAIFSADDRRIGQELWRSDGSPAGTVLLADVNGGGTALGSDPGGFVDLPHTTLFMADDGVVGREIWRTNGTSARTTLANDVDGVPTSSPLTPLIRVGRRCMSRADFRGTPYLIATDGLSPHQILLPASSQDSVGSLVSKDEQTAYVFLREYNHQFGYFHRLLQLTELGGTTSVSLNLASAMWSPTRPWMVGNTVFFVSGNQAIGLEPFSQAGLVADIAPGTATSHPAENLALAIGNLALFDANDGRNGAELWRSTGTGASLVMDLNPGPASGNPRNGVVVGSGMFFVADSELYGTELWYTDGSPSGTIVLDLVPGPLGSSPSTLIAQHRGVYFSAGDSSGDRELWFSNGSLAGTRRVLDLAPGSSNPVVLAAVGSRRVMFTADDGVNGRELYESDGTPAGTRMLAPIAPGLADPKIDQLHVREDGLLLFPADDLVNGRELFAHDPGAVARKLGSSCGSTVLPLLSFDDPVLNSLVAFRLDCTAAAQFGALIMGLPTEVTYGSGCRLYVDLAQPLLAFPVPIQAGTLNASLMFPNDPSLSGMVARAQVVAGPTARPQIGLDFSNGIALRLGR